MPAPASSTSTAPTRPAVLPRRRVRSATPAAVVPTARARKPPIITAADGDGVEASALIPSRVGSYPGYSSPATTVATTNTVPPARATRPGAGEAPVPGEDRRGTASWLRVGGVGMGVLRV